MSKKFLFTLVTLIVIGGFASIAIFFAKGYTISSVEKKIVGTGIVTIASTPDSASVYVDGHLTTATNATISSLPPKTYEIKVIKEGFIPWQKNIEVKEGIVTELKITLFPAIPSTYGLTSTGVINPTVSPDSSKLAYIAISSKKNGIWVWTMVNNQPIAFVRSSEPHQIVSSTVADFSKATLKWSPDSKQVLATVGNNNYLLDSNTLNTDPKDITPTLQATLQSWADDIKLKEEARIIAIKDFTLRKVASDSSYLRWSPDETKFMARKEAISAKESSGSGVVSGIKVYDLIEKKEYPLPAAQSFSWLPDSKHIIMVEPGQISLVEFDGTNKATVYAGGFKDGFVFPWPDSSRLVFINSIPTPTASEPNLYGINLK